ncbi:HAMP domain-containing sensor histidine kinase [Gottfriedia acidiceleris]|uniref:HAMP domain-containing sensor histidine kinase n=1 Tax=Gottfriedia acidiceleris TaxID=371036 RepID=UPI003398D570
MKNKTNMLLQWLFSSNKLRMRIIWVSVVLIVMTTIPVNIFALYTRLQYVTAREYSALFYRALKIQKQIEDRGPSIFKDEDYFDALIFPGDELYIDPGIKGLKDYTNIANQTHDYQLSFLQNQILSSIVPLIYKAFTKDIKYLGYSASKANFSFYIDNNKKAYGVVSYSFPHQNHYDTIKMKRELTPQFVTQFKEQSKVFLFMFLWSLIIAITGVLICLRFVFKPLQKAIDTSFNEVIESNYQDRIKDPGYGEEISKVINRFNKVLDRMHELVQSNLNSMQDVSHEVKTNLTAIKQNVDLLKLYGKEDEQLVDEKIESIEEHISRVSSIMAIMLDLARLKQNAKIDDANYYDIKYLTNFFLNIKKKEYPDFIFETSYLEKDLEIFIDRKHFFLIVSPIIDNAVKYSIDSNIIRVHILHVELENRVYIFIKNIGVLIEEREIPYLFDRYYRGKHPSRIKQGAGLGLTIAKEVMDLYKGKFLVVSIKGETTFGLGFNITNKDDKSSGD